MKPGSGTISTNMQICIHAQVLTCLVTYVTGGGGRATHRMVHWGGEGSSQRIDPGDNDQGGGAGTA